MRWQSALRLPPHRSGGHSFFQSHPWPLTLAIACLLLAAGSAPGADVRAQSDHQPSISVEPDTLDFGDMNQYEENQAEIVISNRGGAVLQIHEVRPSCGCTLANLDVEKLEPGESTTLNLTFNSQRMVGPQTKTVRIYTNDPVAPNYMLVIAAHVHAPVLVRPPTRQITFGKVRLGQTKQQKVEFEAEEVPELTITPTRYNEDLFEVVIEPRYQGDPQQVLMKVNIKENAPLGDHREFIRVEASVENTPPIDIETFAEIVRDLYVDKTRIRFGYVFKDEVMENHVRVRAWEEGIGFKVTGAEIDLPNFEIKIEESIPNLETRVSLSGTPLPASDPLVQEAEGRMKGTLRIFTNLPQQPEIEVAVIYLLKL